MREMGHRDTETWREEKEGTERKEETTEEEERRA